MPNLLFVQAAVEDLPSELDGLANGVNVSFPWGSLLRAIVTGDLLVLNNLRKICLPEALLKATIGLDLERDFAEIDRLALPHVSIEYVNAKVAMNYRKAGFRIVKSEVLARAELSELQSSWARRLELSPNRSFMRITAQAIDRAS